MTHYSNFTKLAAASSMAIGAKGGEVDFVDSAGNLSHGGVAITATAAELNNAADVSGRVQQLTASGAVTAGVQSIEIDHDSVPFAATIADASAHQGTFLVKDNSSSAATAHTVTLAAGTWDGSNAILTTNALNDALAVHFDSAGNGTILSNVGSVVLS